MVNNQAGKILILSLHFLCVIFQTHAQRTTTVRPKAATVKISFINTVKGMPLVLDSMEYTNPFNEIYTVSRLKYYISNISLNNPQKHFAEAGSYHLIDAADSASLHFSFGAAANTYNSISFMVGVDSIKNVSGAQTGALDPSRGMFWTWNSGYIMFKLEGNSTASSIFNHKIEYHIGGFAGKDNVVQLITIPLSSPLKLDAGKSSEIIITADLDKIWHGTNELKIAETPVTMSPGILSKKIADNYNRMFSIKELK